MTDPRNARPPRLGPLGWPTSRRRALRHLAALAGAAGLGAAPATARPALPPALACLSDRRGARRIGRTYLAAYPEEADADRLAKALEREIGSATERTAVRRALRDAARRDLRDGRSVLVEGWVLARTEARLCALAALV